MSNEDLHHYFENGVVLFIPRRSLYFFEIHLATFTPTTQLNVIFLTIARTRLFETILNTSCAIYFHCDLSVAYVNHGELEQCVRLN